MKKRTGDPIKIRGDYQHRALTQGHPVQRFWHASKQYTISHYLPPAPGDFALDVGCGSGVISSFLGKHGATVLGVDSNSEALEFANRKFHNDKVTFRHGLVDATFSLDRPPDKIYSIEVIEHIYYDQGLEMLKNFSSLIRPGGKVFITTPNYASPWPLIEWTMDRFHLAPPMAGVQHVTQYRKKTLESLCREAGFTINKSFSACLLSPWIAPLSWRLAKALHLLETKIPAPLGCLLVLILEKPEHPRS